METCMQTDNFLYLNSVIFFINLFILILINLINIKNIKKTKRISIVLLFLLFFNISISLYGYKLTLIIPSGCSSTNYGLNFYKEDLIENLR